MSKKIILFISMFLLSILKPVIADNIVTLKVAHGAPETLHMSKAWVNFKEEVEKNSKGKMKVEIYPAGQMGEDRELLEFVQSGEIDFTSPAVGVLSAWDNAFSATELPYIFPNKVIARNVLLGEYGNWLGARLDTLGLKSVGWFEIGVRQLTNSSGPVHSPDDVKGLKIRTMQVDAHIEAWKKLGANPLPMASGEVFSALQQKVIDAQENPLTNIKAMRVNEVNKYITLTNHVYSAYSVVMNPAKFNSLSDENKSIVLDAVASASEYQQLLINNEEPELISWFEEQGNVINSLTPEEIKLFQDKIKELQPLYEKLVGKDTYEKLVSAIKKEESKN